MHGATFRHARADDFSQIRELARRGWTFAYPHLPPRTLEILVEENYSERKLAQSLQRASTGRDVFVVAEQGGHIIGFCHAGVPVSGHAHQGELHRLYIEPELIGKGLGKKLLLIAEKFLKDKGCRTYYTFAHKQNKTGLDFYLRNEFIHHDDKDQSDELKNGKVLWYLEKAL